jgi:hypothetical protein
MKKLNYSYPWEVLGMDEKKRLEWAFNRFYEYGKKRAKYLAVKHDLSEIEITSLIPSGLMAKCLELYEAEKNKNNVYNALIVDCVARVFGIVKASIARLNFNKGGVYSEAHISTDNMEYLPNVGAVFHESKLIEKPNLKGGKQVDIIDILEQWENRASRTEQKIRAAIFSLNCEGIKINSENMSDEERKQVEARKKELARASIKAQEIVRLSGYYETPEEALIYKCNMAKLDTRFKNILFSREELSDSDKKYLRRWKRRNGCDGVRIEDLREYFLG